MLRSFLTITLRILWRNKITSFINIFSLTIGITAFILIMLYVHHELSYDKFNENYDRICRLEGDDYGKLPPMIGDYLKGRIPEIENIARLADGHRLFVSYVPTDNQEAKKEVQISRFWADSTTFNLFTFPFIQGDPTIALNNPFTVVLTESTAYNLLGKKNPVGETVECNGHQFLVTGLIEDVKNFHLDIDAFFSLESISKMYPERNLNDAASNSWLWCATYLLIAEKSDPGLVEEKINEVLAEINDGNLISIQFEGFNIRPMSDIYFKGSTANLQYGNHGNLKLVRTFMIIAVFILSLACTNYVNLTTARATLRRKEVAMKKVVGSSKMLLRYQFIFESILVTILSFLLAFTLVQGLIPQFNQLALVDISMGDFNNPTFWLLSIAGIIFIGFFSGLYPAIYLTTIRFSALMKGGKIKGYRGAVFRRVLLTFQFSISIILIIGILTNLRQLHYARSMDLGFNKDYVITVSTAGQRETIKERLLQNPNILKVSFTANTFGKQLPISGTFEIDGEKKNFNWLPIDPDYLDLMGIDIKEGRNFSWDREGDCMWNQEEMKLKDGQALRFIVNETAATKFWDESPVDKIYNGKLSGVDFQFEVIGIMKDFHYQSVHHEIGPIFFMWNWLQHLLCIKISSANIPSTIKFIENEWEKVYGSTPFNYSFLDETFDAQYSSDEQVAKIIGYFTILAIVIACMGLFALSSFMVVRRTKEIGIRKAMGASVENIFLLLSREFVKWVLIAAIIACPIAWFLMAKWLQSFAYKINLGVDIFFLAALLALFIALLTVVWQSLKSALANPVNALRYE